MKMPELPDQASSDETSTSRKVEHGGSVFLSPILAVARFATTRGMCRDRVEQLIGTSLSEAIATTKVHALAGPRLLAQIMEDGLGSAPAIEIARDAPLSFFSGLERGVLLAPNGHEALHALASNFAVFHNGLDAYVEESERHIRFAFRFDGVEFDNGCGNEVVLSMLVRMMRSVFGRYGQPVDVHTRFDRNGVKSVYDDFFASPIRFRSDDQSFGAVWRKDDLQWRQPGHDPVLFEHALQRLSATAEARRHNDAESRYHELVSASNRCVQSGVFSVAAVASEAGLGERTAQRIARRHGASLGRLIDRARLGVLSEQLSISPNASIEDLSELLGFSDGRALRRALKSWTGQSLRRIRNAHASPGNPFKATRILLPT